MGGDDEPPAPKAKDDEKPDPTPMAEGGDISFITVDEDTYEVHVFSTVGSYSLSFGESVPEESITADVLVVGGGGGSGGNGTGDRSGGGGAGGLLYQTGQNLTLDSGSVTVTVGAGGDGGAARTQGANGGLSSIGGITVPGGGGGGGGVGSGVQENGAGKDGGSGGGGGALSGSYSGSPGTAAESPVLGNNGGNAGPDSGGGGGGATDVGGNVIENCAGTGGAGWKPSVNEAAWIELVTGTEEFSHGGRGGSNKGEPEGQPGANYGDGGSGSNGNSAAGTAGHSGIVVIRFPYEGT
jgi:hypothetical protein